MLGENEFAAKGENWLTRERFGRNAANREKKRDTYDIEGEQYPRWASFYLADVVKDGQKQTQSKPVRVSTVVPAP